MSHVITSYRVPFAASSAKKKPKGKRKAAEPDADAVADARMRAALQGQRDFAAAITGLSADRKRRALGNAACQEEFEELSDEVVEVIALSKTQGRGGAWEARARALLRRDKGSKKANFGTLRWAIEKKGSQSRMAKKDGDVIRAGRLDVERRLLEDRWLELIAEIETVYPEYQDVKTRKRQKVGLGKVVKQYYDYINRQYRAREGAK